MASKSSLLGGSAPRRLFEGGGEPTRGVLVASARTPLQRMGKFTAIGMFAAVPRDSIVVDTCAHNDTSLEGDDHRLAAFNPTNRRFSARHLNVEAVSVETLAGRWGRGKKARPLGHWNGDGGPLLTTPGDARRTIYLPAYRLQVERWLASSATLRDRIARLRADPRDVFARDYDTGWGVDNAVDEKGREHGPMSHAWALCVWLNTGEWPERDAACVPSPRQQDLFGGRT